MNNKMLNSPCLNCENRKELCHSICNDYKEYRNNLDKKKEDITKGNFINKYIIGYLSENKLARSKSHLKRPM